MVEITEINLKENTVTYKDGKTISHTEFMNKFNTHWDHRIAGETINVADMERFMRRGSSKNLKQLIDVKKTEGTLEALIGKKMDPKLVKLILILALVGLFIIVAFIVMQKMGLMTF